MCSLEQWFKVSLSIKGNIQLICLRIDMPYFSCLCAFVTLCLSIIICHVFSDIMNNPFFSFMKSIKRVYIFSC